MDANTKSLLESLKNAIEAQDKRQMGYLLAKLQDTSEFAVLLPFIQNGNEYQALSFIESWLDDELNASLDKLIEWADENNISADKFPRDRESLTNLKELDLRYCKLETLPNEFANLQSLEKLNLYYYHNFTYYYNDFKTLPQAVCKLINLKYLNLGECGLKSLPDEFANLQKLEKLDFGTGEGSEMVINNFREFPKVICKLTNLKELDLSYCNLELLPSEFANLQSLEKLSLDGNEIQKFPKPICKLKNLKELNFDGYYYNKLESLPDDFANLQSLERLVLSQQAFQIFPKVVCKLKNLKELDLWNCHLKSLPDEFANLQKLEKLKLSGNNFQEFPNVILKLTNLKELYLHSCGLEYLPDEFANLQNLEKLELNNNEFQGFPKVVDILARLKNLKELDLGDCGLVSLPDGFANLQRLKKLNLSNLVVIIGDICSHRNKFKEFPKVLFKLEMFKECKELDLRGWGLESLPDEFANLQNLEKLNLWSNKFQEFPKAILKLTNLKELNLESCDLKFLPDKFANLQKLEKLKLGNNKFQEFPKVVDILARLKNLKELELWGCGLESLPNEFANLQRLEMLDLWHNEFQEFPKVLCKLKMFKECKWLDLSQWNVDSLPDEFANLQNLEWLKLGNNKFQEFPKVVDILARLKNLKELELWGCGLESLPDEFAKLQGLEKLGLEGNKFQEIPKAICKLKNLKELDLRSCGLESLPDEFANLQNLKRLDLCFNKFQEFPKAICKLKNLKKLNWEECDLESLPDEFANLQNLERLYLKWNKFQEFPQVLDSLPNLSECDIKREDFKKVDYEVNCDENELAEFFGEPTDFTKTNNEIVGDVLNEFRVIIQHRYDLPVPQSNFIRRDSIVNYEVANLAGNNLYVYIYDERTLLGSGLCGGFYKNPLDGNNTRLGAMINEIKYKTFSPSASQIEHFAGCFGEYLGALCYEREVIITPIPSSKRISNELAAKLARDFNLKCEYIINKNDNAPQAKAMKNFKEGLQNAYNKYNIDESVVKRHLNCEFIVVDDVFGSGASLCVIMQKLRIITGHSNSFLCVAKDIGR